MPDHLPRPITPALHLLSTAAPPLIWIPPPRPGKLSFFCSNTRTCSTPVGSLRRACAMVSPAGPPPMMAICDPAVRQGSLARPSPSSVEQTTTRTSQEPGKRDWARSGRTQAGTEGGA
eukprot:760044-Hanusia_phi.AAC.1